MLVLVIPFIKLSKFVELLPLYWKLTFTGPTAPDLNIKGLLAKALLFDDVTGAVGTLPIDCLSVVLLTAVFPGFCSESTVVPTVDLFDTDAAGVIGLIKRLALED